MDRIDLSPRRAVWFVVGGVALTLGAIGVVLPLLPTTPFVLLSAFAFGKSTPAYKRWLKHSHLFGPMIADWRTNGAIAPRQKAISIATMAVTFCVSLALSLGAVVLAVQAICMAGAAAYILSRPSGTAPSR